MVAILTPIYEAEFLGFSYGFRPGRSQHQALDALAYGIKGKYIWWVLDADIAKFFDTVSHEWLIRFLEYRIGDRRIIRLIQKWLKAGMMENGVRYALLVSSTQSSMTGGVMQLSRRARTIADDREFASFQISRLLPKELLNKRIADTVWAAFIRGHFDCAVFLAMKGVEVAVRAAATQVDEKLIGVDLMRAAFHPQNGPLTDRNTKTAEREGRAAFFARAIGSYKNPQSHRDVDLEDAQEALETIFLANHLLRIVDARMAENAKASS